MAFLSECRAVPDAGGRWRACREMGHLVRAYDGSGADAGLLRELCASGAPQAALALAAAESTVQVALLGLCIWKIYSQFVELSALHVKRP